MVKNQPANAGDAREVVSSPGQEDPLEKEMATHSSVLAWETARAEEPGWLAVQSMGLKVGRDLANEQQLQLYCPHYSPLIIVFWPK